MQREVWRLVSAIVFDFDGVLANSEPLHLAAYQEICASLGFVLTREDYFANYLGYDDEAVFRKLGAAHGWKMEDDAVEALVAEKARAFAEVLERTDVLYPDAAACVARLAREFPVGIASGALRQEIQMILGRAGLQHHFQFIVAAGDTPRSKPWPDPYLRAAELHGVRPGACVAIEDSRWGIESARAAGLKCFGISTTYPASELRAADRVIDSLTDLQPELIRALGANSARV